MLPNNYKLVVTSTNHNRNDASKKSLAELPRGVEERFQNIEKHLEIGNFFIIYTVYISRG